MQTDRRSILHLVALGRITPAEAERLLIAWNEGLEVVWGLIACIAASTLTQVHLHELVVGLARAAHTFLGAALQSSHHALALVTHYFGGVL